MTSEEPTKLWAPHEDSTLLMAIYERPEVANEDKNWAFVSSKLPHRSASECQSRWKTHIDPKLTVLGDTNASVPPWYRTDFVLNPKSIYYSEGTPAEMSMALNQLHSILNQPVQTGKRPVGRPRKVQQPKIEPTYFNELRNSVNGIKHSRVSCNQVLPNKTQYLPQTQKLNNNKGKQKRRRLQSLEKIRRQMGGDQKWHSVNHDELRNVMRCQILRLLDSKGHSEDAMVTKEKKQNLAVIVESYLYQFAHSRENYSDSLSLRQRVTEIIHRL